LPKDIFILITSILQQRRQSLRSLMSTLEPACFIITTDYVNAWDIVQKRPPAVLVIDKCFSGSDVKDLLTRVKETYPAVRCIALDDAFQGGNQPALDQADVILNSDLPTNYLLDAVQQQILSIRPNLTPAHEAGKNPLPGEK
jgi:hypothetical protein